MNYRWSCGARILLRVNRMQHDFMGYSFGEPGEMASAAAEEHFPQGCHLLSYSALAENSNAFGQKPALIS